MDDLQSDKSMNNEQSWIAASNILYTKYKYKEQLNDGNVETCALNALIIYKIN